MSNLSVSRQFRLDLNQELQKGKIKLGGKDSRVVAVPVEEGLFILTIEPLDIVKVKIVSISMTWINLEKDQIKRQESVVVIEVKGIKE